MPESPNPKIRPVPPPGTPPGWRLGVPPYAELGAVTNFSFLRGASHPDELLYRAAELGYRAFGVADVNTLSGVVRAHEAAKKTGVPLLVGARLTFVDACDVLVWAQDRAGYGRLCRLLTTGKRRAGKGECWLSLSDLLENATGLQAAAAPPDGFEPAELLRPVVRLREAFDDRLSLTACCPYGRDDRRRVEAVAAVGRAAGVPLLATNHPHYHDPSRRMLQDVLTCVRHGCTVREAGYRLFANGERYLKPPGRMHELFAPWPGAIERGLEVARSCTFSLDQLKYEYPDEVVPAGKTAIGHLVELAWAGAATRYPAGVPGKVSRQIEHELELIGRLKYEAYFLTVHDLVMYARKRDILCQGRGSAANSAVCYCLGVTAVDPSRIDVLFERFVSSARNEPPDIDVDFEHERREEVIQYVYEKYGRERAGMTAEIITYRGRSAVRDVGKALGLGLDLVDQMARKLDGWHRGTLSESQLREVGLDPADRTVQQVIALTAQLLGFPRHLGQHVGGMVMTRGPLCEMVPIENAVMADRTVIEWDKDDIDTLGILKVDLLALGMLTCIAKGLALVNQSVGATPASLARGGGTPASPENATVADDGAARVCPADNSSERATPASPLQLHTIPAEDPAVYDMACDADTVGVFQIESRAQMSMLPRLKPREFYDLVIEVAIVRPGPIQGDMVHPYLRRRTGQEKVEYPSEALRQVLGKTLGVPLFQEQAMRLVMVAAGFSAEEADRLRKAMAAWRRQGALDEFYPKVVGGMLRNGYTREFAERCFQQIKGFGEYGFPESHAASFALLVYASAWLKRRHPAAFACALLNSQPMGFYAPAQIVRDAREHGVTVRPVDVNASDWDCTLEGEGGDWGDLGFKTVDFGLEGRGRVGLPDLQSQISNPKSSIPNPKFKIPSPSDKRTWGVGGPVLRLGMRMIKGLREAHARQVVACRKRAGAFASIEHLHRATGLPAGAIRRLAAADAFTSLQRPRRQASWEAMALEDGEAPLFDLLQEKGQAGSPGADDPTNTESTDVEPAALPPMPVGQEVMADYATVGLSLKRHPVALVRGPLAQRGVIRAAEVNNANGGRRGWVKVAGLVLIRQRPGTASGIVFVTLEDESGVVNLIVRPEVYDRYRAAARGAMLLQADGYVERQGQVVHVLACRLHDMTPMLEGYVLRSRDFR